MLNEFEIIQHYFNPQHRGHPEIIQGIGDDAAVWQVDNATLVTSVDTLLAGRHFFADCAPADIAYKALAVNLSDMAAMGAKPRWFTLALTLPQADATWLHAFSASLLALANEYGVALIGGDTTQGPLSITIQIIGTIDKNKMLLRSAAKAGDHIYVSGTLGDAGLALRYLQNKISLTDESATAVLPALHRPTAQVALGLALAGYAHAAIDISDGLAQDLGHILQASGLGAMLYLDQLPVSPVAVKALGMDAAQELALTAGDDYQLCFTLPLEYEKIIKDLSAYQITRIGEVTQTPGLQIMQHGQLYQGTIAGFDHFDSTYPPSH